MAGTSLYPDVAENCMSTSFSHIFFKVIFFWIISAEVLDADAFVYFQEKEFFTKKWPQNLKITYFQKVAELPMELYKRFRGQEPQMLY
jgi:peptidyl-dipeptidase Dcp